MKHQPWRTKKYSADFYRKLRSEARRYRIIANLFIKLELAIHDAPRGRSAVLDASIESRNVRAETRRRRGRVKRRVSA